MAYYVDSLDQTLIPRHPKHRVPKTLGEVSVRLCLRMCVCVCLCMCARAVTLLQFSSDPVSTFPHNPSNS